MTSSSQVGTDINSSGNKFLKTVSDGLPKKEKEKKQLLHSVVGIKLATV